MQELRRNKSTKSREMPKVQKQESKTKEDEGQRPLALGFIDIF
jgi:hypothetical protein